MLTIGEKIKHRREELGLTSTEVAKYIGVDKSTMQRYETGAIKKIPIDNVEKIAEILQTTPDFFLNYERQKDTTKKIPLLGCIAAGTPITAIENIDRWVNVDEDDDVDFALEVKGDSMTGARIYDGDIIYIREQKRVNNGEIAAVVISDGFLDGNEATCKRFYQYGDLIVLRSENPAYKDIEIKINKYINNHITVLGKVMFLRGYIQ